MRTRGITFDGPTTHRIRRNASNSTLPRPDLRDAFRAQIDAEENPMRPYRDVRRPHGVTRIDGNVHSRTITAHMDDGTTWSWQGGRYATRKRNGCYATLMPTPLPRTPQQNAVAWLSARHPDLPADLRDAVLACVDAGLDHRHLPLVRAYSDPHTTLRDLRLTAALARI